MKPSTLLCLLSLIIIPLSVFSQDSDSQNETIRVFLDCNRCDQSFIKQEIPFVNYVRDKEDSEIHLLITRQRTGSNGTEYTLRFLGRDRFEGQKDTLQFVSASSDTEDEQRRGLVRTIKIGLFPFISKTKAIQNITVNYKREGEVQSTAEEDKWNYWIFELDGRSFFNGEESRSNLFISLGASADRVTPESKNNFGYDYDFNRRTFTELDSVGNESTNSFTTRSQRFDGLYVKSLNNHWSAGISAEGLSSSRENIDLSLSGGPAIEYNIFPYEEYSTHEISFLYKISPGYFDYDKTTIYNKNSEFLVRQQLLARMDFTQPWGEIEGRINTSAYLHDFTKNRVDMNLEFDFRIFRGLSLSIDGRYSLINDQLSIPKGNISDTEQLLNLREQATSYSYRGSIGIEYSFGSIYNNVVNPRF